jgi:hypothetical protein
MRMFREARNVVIRRVRPELIEQEERIELRQLRLANYTPELHTRAIRSRHAAYHANHRTGCCVRRPGGVGTCHL